MPREVQAQDGHRTDKHAPPRSARPPALADAVSTAGLIPKADAMGCTTRTSAQPTAMAAPS